MITWIFERLVVGAICLALAGCVFPAPDDTAGTAPRDSALSAVTLARGAVALVPPTGYCIDQDSLTETFALMARCDRLGGTSASGTPVAVITAATVNQNSVLGLTRAFGADNERIIARRQGDDITLLQVKGIPPSPNMRDVYWRGVAKFDNHVLGLTIYEAADSADLGESAPNLVTQSLRRSIAQTQARAAARQDNSATTAVNPTTN